MAQPQPTTGGGESLDNRLANATARPSDDHDAVFECPQNFRSSSIMLVKDDPMMMAFPTQAKFRAWLDKNHAKAPEIWVKLAKKGSGIKTVNYQEAVEVALCYGWIDGLARRLDEDF